MNRKTILFLILSVVLVLPSISIAPLTHAPVGVNPQLEAQVTGGWTSTAPMHSPRSDHTATLLSDGKVLVAGGFDSSGFLSSAEIYDPQLGSWSLTTSMPTSRAYGQAARLPDGTIIVAGGYGSQGAISSAIIYDPATGLWTPTGSMNTARDNFALVSLNNGKFLALGGFDNRGVFLASCEIYDPTTGSWTNTGPLHTGRAALDMQNQVVTLADGRVLVEGGLNPSNVISDLASAELYDSQARTWSLTGSMNIPRTDQSAALLPSGKVMVSGGDAPRDGPSTSEIFDPSTGSWTMAAFMTEFRAADSATSLLDGRVLVVGPLGPSTESYDETTGTWTNAGSRNIATREHTATLLDDGRVLIAGGGQNGVLYSQADLFTPETRRELRITTFFTDPSLNPLASDPQGSPAVNVTFVRGIVRSNSPNEVLAWVNVTNTSGSSVQSLKMNETLPVDWIINPAWMPGKGAVHVYYANTTSLASNSEITDPSTITVSTSNSGIVQLAIPSLNATGIGHPLSPGQSILMSVKLSYALKNTIQSPANYPIKYVDSVSAVAFTQSSYMGAEASGTGSDFFTAYANSVGDVLVSFGSFTVRAMVAEKYWLT